MTSAALGGEALRRIAGKVDRYEAGVEREAAHTRAGAAAAAELTQELRALRDTLANQSARGLGEAAAGDSTSGGVRGRPQQADSRARGGAGRSASAAARRAGRPGGADGVADSTAASTALPPSPGAGAGREDATVEGQLRRELRRMTEAYATLVKETRLYKEEADSRERALEVEVTRLKQAAATAERAKRDQDAAAGSIRGLREELATANATIASLKERVTARAKDKERESGQVVALERQITQLRNELEAARTTIATNSAVVSAAVATEAKLAATTRQLAVAAEERDVLLDHVQDLQRKYNEADAAHRAAAAQLATASARLADAGAVAQELARLQAQVAEADAAAKAAQAEAAAASAAAEGAATLQATVEELQHVQAELLRTISSQASELETLKRSAAASGREAATLTEAAARDARRFKRLERMLDEYRAVEKEFIRRTGQGFWGPVGLAHALWADAKLPGGGAAPGSPLGGGGTAAAPSAPIATAPEASDDLPVPLFEYLQRLEANLEADARARLQQERQAHDAAVDARLAGLRSELAAAGEMIAGLRAELAAAGDYKAAVGRAEAEVAVLLDSAARDAPLSQPQRGGAALKRRGSASSASSDDLSSIGEERSDDDGGDGATPAPDKVLDQEALSRLQWRSLPTLHATLPRIGSALERIRAEFALALRRRRIAETEAVDLKEEVAGLRAESHAQELVRGMTALDVKVALRDAKVERGRLQAELEAAQARLKEADTAARTDAERLTRYRARVRKAKELLATYGERATTAETARAEAADQVVALQEAVARLTQRVQDVSALNAQALNTVAQRDTTIGLLRVKLRTLQALVGPGGTAAATAALRAEVDAARARLGLPEAGGGLALDGDFQDVQEAGVAEGLRAAIAAAAAQQELPSFGSELDETELEGAGSGVSVPTPQPVKAAKAAPAQRTRDAYAALRAVPATEPPVAVQATSASDSSVSLSLNSTAVAGGEGAGAAAPRTAAAVAAAPEPVTKSRVALSKKAQRVPVEALPVPVVTGLESTSPSWYLSPTPRGEAEEGEGASRRASTTASKASNSNKGSRRSSSKGASPPSLQSSSPAVISSPATAVSARSGSTPPTTSPQDALPAAVVTTASTPDSSSSSSSSTARLRRHRLDAQLLQGSASSSGRQSSAASSPADVSASAATPPSSSSLFGDSRRLFAWEEVLSPNTTVGAGRGGAAGLDRTAASGVGYETFLSAGDTTRSAADRPSELEAELSATHGTLRSPLGSREEAASPLLDAEALGLLSPEAGSSRRRQGRTAAGLLGATAASLAVSTPSPSGATRRLLPVADTEAAADDEGGSASLAPQVPTPPSSKPPSPTAVVLPVASVPSAPVLVAPAFSSAVTVAAARGSATGAAVVVAPAGGAVRATGIIAAGEEAGSPPPSPGGGVTYTVETTRVPQAGGVGSSGEVASPSPLASPPTRFTVRVKPNDGAGLTGDGSPQDGAVAGRGREAAAPQAGSADGGRARRQRSVSRGAGLRDLAAADGSVSHQAIVGHSVAATQ